MRGSGTLSHIRIQAGKTHPSYPPVFANGFFVLVFGVMTIFFDMWLFYVMKFFGQALIATGVLDPLVETLSHDSAKVSHDHKELWCCHVSVDLTECMTPPNNLKAIYSQRRL